MIRGPESQTLYPYPEHSKLVPSVILDTTMGNMKLEVILLLFFLRLLFVFFLHQCSLRLLPRFHLLFGFLLDQTSHLLLVSSLDHQSSLWSFPSSNLLIFSLLSAKFGVNFSHLHVNLESQNLPLQSLQQLASNTICSRWETFFSHSEIATSYQNKIYWEKNDIKEMPLKQD